MQALGDEQLVVGLAEVNQVGAEVQNQVCETHQLVDQLDFFSTFLKILVCLPGNPVQIYHEVDIYEHVYEQLDLGESDIGNNFHRALLLQ